MVPDITGVDDTRVSAVAGRAVSAAGELLVRLRGTAAADARLKNGHEVVTEADLQSDAAIRRVIAAEFPDHRILSEETWTGWSDGLLDGPVWVVDPLDGSVNFAHSHPYVSVSVAFAVDGVVLVGAVHAPFLQETFEAVKGRGAFCNGVPLAVAHTSRLEEALVSTGLPHDRSELSSVVERFRRLAVTCRDVRRAGSPALDISWVAAGRLDAHTESLAPWDVAAAGLIAVEAGARRTVTGHEHFPFGADLAGAGIVISTPGIHEELCLLLEDIH